MITTPRIILAVAVAQSCQSPTPQPVLSAPHRATIQAEALVPAVLVRHLPSTVMARFADSALELTDDRLSPLPWTRSRRLILAGCGPDHCVVHYEQGGFGRSFHVVVFGLNKDTAQVEWSGVIKRQLKNLEELKAVVIRAQRVAGTN